MTPKAGALGSGPGKRHDEDPNRSFARFLLTDILTDEEHARARRLAVAAWLLGAALALLALAMPTERLLGSGPEMVSRLATETSSGFLHWLHFGLTAALAELWTKALGTTLEAGAYLTSALAYGLCLPALWHLARAVGATPGVALGLALLLLASPAAWLSGTLPGYEAAALLGLSLWLLAVFRQPRARALEIVLLTAAVLLLPALAPISLITRRLHGGRTGPDRTGADRTRQAPSVVGLAIALVLILPCLRHWLWLGSVHDGLSTVSLLAPRARLLWPAAPGAALLLARALREQPAREQESAPPSWLLVLTVALVVGALFSWPASVLTLPILAIAGAYGCDQRSAARVRRLAVGLFAAQLALAVTCCLLVARTDPDAYWRERVTLGLDPDDALLTNSSRHGYLLRHRWGVATARPALGRLPAEVLETTGARFYEWVPQPSPPPPELVERLQTQGFVPLTGW